MQVPQLASSSGHQGRWREQPQDLSSCGPLLWAERTIKTRRLSHNEEVRIGTALYVALERIKSVKRQVSSPAETVFSIRPPTLAERWRAHSYRRRGAMTRRRCPSSERSMPRSYLTKRSISARRTSCSPSWMSDLSSPMRPGLFADENNDAERVQVQLDAEEGTIRASPTLLFELFELANLGLLGAWQGGPQE